MILRTDDLVQLTSRLCAALHLSTAELKARTADTKHLIERSRALITTTTREQNRLPARFPRPGSAGAAKTPE